MVENQRTRWFSVTAPDLLGGLETDAGGVQDSEKSVCDEVADEDTAGDHEGVQPGEWSVFVHSPLS